MANKKQTFISKIEDNNGRMIDFERWSYKSVKTVAEKALELHNTLMEYEFYRNDVKNATRIAIYNTPDGVNHSGIPFFEININ